MSFRSRVYLADGEDLDDYVATRPDWSPGDTLYVRPSESGPSAVCGYCRHTDGVDIGWGEPRCIMCLGTPRDDDPDSVMTKGPVIPQSVGGVLFAPNGC
jgi:hypothetical protein